MDLTIIYISAKTHTEPLQTQSEVLHVSILERHECYLDTNHYTLEEEISTTTILTNIPLRTVMFRLSLFHSIDVQLLCLYISQQYRGV